LSPTTQVGVPITLQHWLPSLQQPLPQQNWLFWQVTKPHGASLQTLKSQ
jgi:hypothetical protein